MDPTFGYYYWDATRDTGYGGYRYDGRWRPIAEDVIRRYGLQPGDRVLDIGCGKGYFLASLLEVEPRMHVCGIDISSYAIEQAHPSVRPFVSLGSADDLSRFADRSFDFVCAMNSIHFLPADRAEVALRELMRVGKPGRYFVHVDAYRNEIERERLLAWAPIIKTVYSVEDWLELFDKLGYDGDYYWTIVQPSQR
ncbi:MAG: class I SAM-dependent methyltransferase [Gemmataceae bacterium]|nr:class I SAM-dependent methyltransferase [Gemmataceae bacterium]